MRPPESPAGTCTAKRDEFLSVHARLIGHLHASLSARTASARQGEAAPWGLTRERLAEALWRSVVHRFGGANPKPAEVSAYLESLHLEDLALACACSDGDEPAWEYFIRHYRHELYAAARAIMGSASSGGVEARDLADSIYAELYGVERRPRAEANADEDSRRPLFQYFHGRSKLSTWLRAVLAQRFVDSVRASQRTESLDETGAGVQGHPHLRARGAAGAAPDPDRTRLLGLLQAALRGAIAALAPRDRLRLACYYAHERTLAEISRILGEHEATASRRLDRTRRELRKQVERNLREQKRLSDAQVRECFELALEDWPFDLTHVLADTQASGEGDLSAEADGETAAARQQSKV